MAGKFDTLFSDTGPKTTTPVSGGRFSDLFTASEKKFQTSSEPDHLKTQADNLVPPVGEYQGIPASYGASQLTDPSSGKPLLTYENPEARQSQLLADRTAVSFDFTKPQKLDPSLFKNGRMPSDVSAAIKKQMGGTHSEELDHKIALELAGTNVKSNLQRELLVKGKTQTATDPLENKLARRVASGEISLLDAQKQLAHAKGYKLPEEGGPVPSAEGAKPGKTDISKESIGETFMSTLPGTTQALADLQTNPLSLNSSFMDIIKTPFKDMTEASDRFNQTLANTIKGFQQHKGAATDVGNILETAASFGGAAMSSISSMFDAASKVPIAGSVIKLLFNIPFALLGDMGGDTGVSVLDGLQKAKIISPKTAQTLEPGVREFSSLVAQIAGGMAIDAAKIKLEARGVSPKDAETIISKAQEVATQKPTEAIAPKEITPPEASRTTLSVGSQRYMDAFDRSSNREVIVNKNGTDFSLGDIGKRHIEDKTISGKADRFPKSELKTTIENIVDVYKGSPDPTNHRSLTAAWISDMPSGEKRVIYTKINSLGQEEITGWHSIDEKTNPNFLMDLKSNGVPTGNRTQILSLERSSSRPLNYGDISNIERSGLESQEAGKIRDEGQSYQQIIDTPPEYLDPNRGSIMSLSSAIDYAKQAIADAKQKWSDNEFGTKLRTYFTGERNIRILQANYLGKDLETIIRDPKQLEALSIYRDFKNKPGELQQFADGTHPLYDEITPRETPTKPKSSGVSGMFRKIGRRTPFAKERYYPTLLHALVASIGDKTEAIGTVKGALEDVIKFAQNPTNEMLQGDAKLTDYYTKTLTEGRKLGFLESSITPEEYVNHLIQEGGKPRTLNAADNVKVYGENHAIASATHLLINQLKDSAIGKFSTRSSAPKDWLPVAPESHLFKNEVPYIDKATGEPQVAYQELYAPPQVVEALRPLTEPSGMSRVPGFKTSRMYGAYIKSMELTLSLFHNRAMELTALNNTGIMNFIESHIQDQNSPVYREIETNAIRAGMETPTLNKQIEIWHKIGTASVPTRMEILRNMPVLKQIDQIGQLNSRLVFDILQKNHKVMEFAAKDAAWMAKNMDATPEAHFDAQRAIAKELNAAFGGLNWEVLGVRKTSLDLSRLMFLAPDWTFSNFLNAKYAFEGGPAGNAGRMFWLKSTITGLTATAALSYILSGKKSPDPTSVYFGKDKSGKDILQNIFFAGAPGDIVNLIKNVSDYGFIQGFAQSVGAKLAPIPRAAIELQQNRNYLGQKIVPQGAGPLVGDALRLKNLAQNLAPIPFSISNFYNMVTDPSKQYTWPEFVTQLLAGTRPRHVVPSGMREITSGKKKGELAPATPKQSLPILEQIKTGKLTAPASKTKRSKKRGAFGF